MIPKRPWENINTILNKGKKVPTYPNAFLDNDVSISDPQKIANAFNTFLLTLAQI